MARKRKVGPGGGDFALNPNRFDYSGGGGGRRGGASIIKKARKETAKPETSMETKKKATRTKAQMSRLLKKLKKKEVNERKFTYDLPNSREMAITGEQKGGLRKEISKFKTNLTKQDKSDRDIVNAYKNLQKRKYNDDVSDYKKSKKSKRWSYKEDIADNFGIGVGNWSDPTVRKVTRKNKKLVKEEFKKQIKKDRAKRKLDESKKRRQRK